MMQKKQICHQCKEISSKKLKVFTCCGYSLCNGCLKGLNNVDKKSSVCQKCKINLQSPQKKPKIQISSNQKNHDSSTKIKPKIKQCPDHQKPIDLICMVDKKILCTHCAIFNGHREHELIPIEQFEKELKEKIGSLNQMAVIKQQTELKLKGKEFQTAIVEELNRKKESMLKEIRNKYQLAFQQLKDAEEKNYNQLLKSFRCINSQINKFHKEKHQLQQQYKGWWKKSQQLIAQFQQTSDLAEKAQIYYGRTLNHLNEGRARVNTIKQKNTKTKEDIINLINHVTLNNSTGLQFSIYNYIKINTPFENVVELDCSWEASKISIKELKLNSVVRPSPVSPRLSPKFNKTLSKKLLYSTSKLPSNKTIRREEDQNDEAKHNENLAFAERMLNEFKNSKDTLDLTGCDLSDDQMYKVIVSANEHKKILNLKIAKNKLTNSGFARIIPYLQGSATLNLSCNQLTEDILEEVICCKDGMINLKIITMTNNKLVNERKAKNKVEELKKLGVMVTI